MAYREVRGGDVLDIKKDVPGEESHEGVYMGFKGITTKLGNQYIYRFKDKSNKIFQMYGFTMLNRVMENISTGSQCRITYLGTKELETKFGLKDVHMVKCEIDDEFVSDVDEEGIPF